VDEAALRRLLAEPIDWRFKGFPAEGHATIGTVAEQRWNLLHGDLPLPAVVLKESALRHNLELIARWCRERGVLLAPHGKTTMAPQLFARQLAAGAWAITAAHIGQVQIYRAFGVQRILLANELVEPVALRWLAAELEADPGFDFYCLVDSTGAVEQMEAALAGCRRRVQVLLELGYEGGRTGARTSEEAAQVAAAVARSATLELAGTECFEGLLGHDRSGAALAAVDDLVRRVRETTIELAGQGAFAGRERVLVSGGGSAYFDRVAEIRGVEWPLDAQVDVVVRPGCYVTHDVGVYERTSPLARELRPALEAWAAVLSRPEPTLALVGLGKRDVSHDVDLPVPQRVHWAGGSREAAGMTIEGLNDQHAYLRLPADDELAVGDLLGCGISHPCTTFDKWRLIPVVADDYTVVDAVATFF
jgi:D-serine deaminase-like pyridoxal phosphate-dependent protein